MRIHSLLTALAICLPGPLLAGDHAFDPPWDQPADGYQFTIPGVENVPDLHGEINDPQLVVFFAGNQFMVVDDLLAAFKARHPQVQRIFAEMLPPGVLARQVETGSATIGPMKITLAPDVFAAGKSRMDAYRKAGGEPLHKSIMEDKTRDGSTFLTQIHHRQTPMRILYGQSQAGPVWHTEAAYQIRLGHPVEEIAIPDAQNIEATYIAGIMKAAPHPEAARWFYEFLNGPEAEAIYRKYDFMPKKS